VGLPGSSLRARIALTVALFGAAATSATALAGCGSILGIDDGISDVDAGAPEVGGGDDGGDAGGDDGSIDGPGDVIAPADGDAGDAGPDDASDAGCTPDPNWCLSHCGPGPDNCGQQRSCSDNCPAGWSCDAGSNTCTCTTDPSWCDGRCGTTTDNCGHSINCGTCDGGACMQNTCGCSPQPDPCGSMNCGSTNDSCGLPVNCGVNGTTACASGGECDGGYCCTPKSNPCAGVCGGIAVDDGCGTWVTCPSTCSGGQECDPNTNTCCTVTTKCAPNTCNTTDSCNVPCNCGDGGACDYMTSQCCPGTVCMNGCCSAGQSCSINTGMCCTPGVCDSVNPCYDMCGNYVGGTCCASDAGSGPESGPGMDGGGACNGPGIMCGQGSLPCCNGMSQCGGPDSGSGMCCCK
jgi:hypothetical protein